MRKIIIIIFGALLSLQVQGQIVSSSSEATPSHNNDATQETVGNNLFTGTLSVPIVFYPFSIEGCNLSVGINYSSQGLKVDQLASSVGLGWELFTGGSIDRVIRGVEDDINVSAPGTVYFVSGPIAHTGYWYENSNDEEPDYFTANVGGKTFSFMFSKTGDILTIPDNANFKVDRTIDGTAVTGTIPHSNVCSDGHLAFIITDEQGNKFYFNNQTEAYLSIQQNHPHAGDVPVTVSWASVNHWFISKVVTYEGYEVDYTYEYPNTTAKLQNAQQFKEKNNNWGEAINNGAINFTTCRLRKISYPNNIDVTFDYDDSHDRVDLPGDKILSLISIRERNVVPSSTANKRSYRLIQSYFKSPSYNVSINPNDYLVAPVIPTKFSVSSAITMSTGAGAHPATQFRLALDQINIIGIDATERSLYKFEYYPVPLPERTRGARDYYGFPNSSTSNSFTNASGETFDLTIEQHDITSSAGPITIGASLDITSDTRILKAWTLTKVTNQNGGEIALDYMKASDMLFVNVSALLLMSKRIYDGYSHQNDLLVEYSYYDGEKFILDEGPFRYNFDASRFNGYPGTYYDMTNQTYTMFSNYGNVLNTQINGTNFGFRKVFEKTKNATTGEQIKKSVYQYTGKNLTDPDLTYIEDNLYDPTFSSSDPDFDKAFFQAPFTNKQYLRSWGIGLLLQTSEYDRNDLITQVSRNYYSVTTAYQSSNFKGIHGLGKKFYPGAWYCDGPDCEGDLASEIYKDVYYPFSGHTTLVKSVDRRYYTNADYLENATNFTYDSKGHLVTKSRQNSTNDLIGETYTYNYQLTGGSGITQLNSDNVSRLVLSISTKTPIGFSSFTGLSATGLVTVSGHIVRPKYFYSLLKPSLPASGGPTVNMAAMSTGGAIAGMQITSVVTKFDDLGNAIEVSDMKGNSDNTFSSSIIDNQKGQTLATVGNAKYGEIAYCGFESDYTFSSPYIKGNLDFSYAGVTNSAHLLGRYSYHCSTSAGHTINTTGALTIGKKYTLSFWSLGSGLSANDGFGGGILALTASATYTDPDFPANTWTLYKADFTATAAGISIWGEGYIDEVRLYPQNTMMTNQVYVPLIGKTADVDMNDKFTTYQYDAFGNQILVRDQNANVIRRTIIGIQE